MDDEEAFASTSGALKLKVAVKDKASKKDKKKKKKKKKDKGKKRALESVPVTTEEPLQPVAQPSMTASEIKFLEKRRKQEDLRLQKAASKSHRERVSEFNSYLAKLSEHHDLPKVSNERCHVALANDRRSDPADLPPELCPGGGRLQMYSDSLHLRFIFFWIADQSHKLRSGCSRTAPSCRPASAMVAWRLSCRNSQLGFAWGWFGTIWYWASCRPSWLGSCGCKSDDTPCRFRSWLATRSRNASTDILGSHSIVKSPDSVHPPRWRKTVTMRIRYTACRR